PASQRCRWSSRAASSRCVDDRCATAARTWATEGLSPSALLSSFMIVLFQAEFLDDAVQGAGELLAPGLGGAAQLAGDLVPAMAGGAQVGDLPFLVVQAVPNLLEQLPALGTAAGTERAGRLDVIGVGVRDAAVVPAPPPLPPDPRDELVAGHRHQDLDELA